MRNRHLEMAKIWAGAVACLCVTQVKPKAFSAPYLYVISICCAFESNVMFEASTRKKKPNQEQNISKNKRFHQKLANLCHGLI